MSKRELMVAVQRVVGSLSAKQVLMQKLVAVTSRTLSSLVVQGHGLLSIHGRAHARTDPAVLSFLHGHGFLHLNSSSHWVLWNKWKILDVQLEIKQLVEVELL